MTDLCPVCEKTIEENEAVTVKARGIRTLLECSKKRRDGKDALFKTCDTVKLHVSCHKSYTREKNVAAAEKASGSGVARRVRSGQPAFNFKTTCFFCNTDASDDFISKQLRLNVHRRVAVSTVTTREFGDSVLETAAARGDQWAEEVTSRLGNDLIADEGRYHQNCMRKFFLPVRSTNIKGRPQDEDITTALQYVCNYIEGMEDECQFSLKEVLKDFPGPKVSEKSLKKRLQDHYGSDIIISVGQHQETVLCFRNTGYKILSQQWYKSKQANEEEERLRVVRAAADIIREDIRSKVYRLDSYPDPQRFLENCEEDIPQTLQVLLDSIIKRGKRGQRQKDRTKVISIAHAVISSTRPRSFHSSLQVGVGALLSRKYGSRELIQIASGLGFCCSYDEARMFEVSCMNHPQSSNHPNSFSQWAFDNADVNVDTIDGRNNFHAMGGIQCVTPAISASSSGTVIARTSTVPKACTVGEFCVIPVTTFEHTGAPLKSIMFEDLTENCSRVDIKLADFKWIFGKWKEDDLPGWNGFMEQITCSEPYSTSQTLFLPFINAPPSNYDTVYTSLLTAINKCKSIKQNVCFVTFDQPLYLKAREIVASFPPDSDLGIVIVRLGGFHLLMSFLGAIGYIMSGSGLQELFCVAYAQVSTETMMAGRAYSRAVRAHILCNLALAHVILTRMSDNERTDQHLEEASTSTSPLEALDHETLKQMFAQKLEELELNGPTAKLWILYFDMTTLMKQFIQAERSGDWELHLTTVKKMLPYFHASGHFLYAKSAQLYLQDMMGLEKKISQEDYTRFALNGWFTIRRSDKFWSGIWSDMTIEQTLMRSLKSTGGLSHGRGISDSTLSRWILTMPTVTTVTQQVEEFCGVSLTTSEQHVDARDARVQRDNADLQKFIEWFQSHDPFPVTNFVMSISTGIVGDDSINCHRAFEIGNSSMLALVGQTFDKIKFVRKKRVMSIQGFTSKVTIDGEDVPVNPETIFHRIALLKKSDEQLKEFFHYELAPYPLSLFDAFGLRKTPKSVLYDLFTPLNEVNLEGAAFVIDGGFLLHRVVWKNGETFQLILTKYVDYLKRHYNRSATSVVFDGYPEDQPTKSIKSAERLRRSKRHTTPEVIFTELMVVTMTQEQFLSNDRNKARLISLLTERLEGEGFSVKQANEDADHLIVATALEVSQEHEKVVVVGEDTDLLIMLNALATPSANIYFSKPGRGTTPSKVYGPNSFKLADNIRRPLIFLHAISGCDTTSALFKQGKKKVVKLLVKNECLLEEIKPFFEHDTKAEAIAEAGLRFLTTLYGGRAGDTLDKLRFELFSRALVKSKFNLASLPPTSEAARQHCLRTYLQVQMWLGHQMDPLLWGWQASKFGLDPVPTSKEPAPQSLLSTIFCKCNKGCAGGCGCRKAAIKCSLICANCKGNSCTNSLQPDEIDEPDVDEDLDCIYGATEITDFEEPSDGATDSVSEITDFEEPSGPTTVKRRRL